MQTVDLQFRRFMNDPSGNPGDYLAPELEDTIEYIEKNDLIAWSPSGSARSLYGVIVLVRPEIQYALVKFEFGARRWVCVDDMQLILKASVLDIEVSETKTAAFATV